MTFLGGDSNGEIKRFLPMAIVHEMRKRSMERHEAMKKKR
jgi:hypothetical protein